MGWIYGGIVGCFFGYFENTRREEHEMLDEFVEGYGFGFVEGDLFSHKRIKTRHQFGSK
jgi:hypothetical protein